MYTKFAFCCLSVCLVLSLIFPFVSFAEDDGSGWPECNLNSATYSQAPCIARAEAYKGTQAPYDFAINQAEAVALWNWATNRPRPLSPCTAAGVGGELLPASYLALCADLPTATPTATWTATPSPTPTVTATPSPTAQPTDQPLELDWVTWLPIVRNGCPQVGYQFGCTNLQ